MKVSELLLKIESREILIDSYNHSISNNQNLIDSFIEIKNDTFNEVKNNGELADHFSLFLEKDLKYEEMLPRQLFFNEECGFCGQKLGWAFDGNKVSLRYYFNENTRKWELKSNNFKCEYSNFKYFKGQINISSPLIITNFFSNVKSYPEGIRRWSYNNWYGRDCIAKYKCKQNVASGAVGNTSLSIYLSKDKSSIILTESSIEKMKFLKNFNYIGNIVLDAWRWEASDLNTIQQKEYELIKSNKNFLELNVPYGNWEFKHFYEFANNCNICSFFKLKS